MEGTDAVKCVVCRVIGNELPPRDEVGGKLRSLEFILKNERVADRYWMLNHLYDSQYRTQVIELLIRHNQAFHEIPFDPQRYRNLTTRRQRVCYAININGARNATIAAVQQHDDFIVCLDQDCFFTEKLWQELVTFLARDQERDLGRQYYGLMMKRISGHDPASADPDRLANDEPQIILRRDAPFWFDPDIPFGDGDKARLLDKLGYGPAPSFTLTGGRCRTAGTVLHYCSGDPEAERDLGLRMRLRHESVEQLLRQLDQRYRQYCTD